MDIAPGRGGPGGKQMNGSEGGATCGKTGTGGKEGKSGNGPETEGGWPTAEKTRPLLREKGQKPGERQRAKRRKRSKGREKKKPCYNTRKIK